MSTSKVQVPAEQYFSSRYCHPGRMAAYGHQIRETINCQPENVLEIGIGTGVVAWILRSFGMPVTTLDHSENLHPDVLASVTDMPLEDNSFDVVLCCEVLEHIAYSDFKKALSEIHRVTKKNLVMSLPDQDRFYRMEARLPLMDRSRRLAVEWPFLLPRRHKFDGEHFWEIGKRGYSLSRVCKDIESSGFKIERTYRMWEIPWHRMFTAVKQF